MFEPTSAALGRQSNRAVAALGVTAMVAIALFGIPAAHAGSPARAHDAAVLDAANLRLAAQAVEAQALATGALARPIRRTSPAVVLLLSDEAFVRAAIRRHPSRSPADMRAVMGPVPYNLAHKERHPPRHAGIVGTHALRRFTHSVPIGGSAGLGLHSWFGNQPVAPIQTPDGVYVDPKLPGLDRRSTVGEVALRAALKKLGQPYVWGGAGPTAYDCSGLVMRAYARGGVRLAHYTVTQWNEGRRIPARDALPGDLILFGHSLFHVAMYLGAGWMLNAPFTGHYVDVVPVATNVAGVVRP
jgi:cell wall-associated NlpC family hydrolase